MAWKAKLSATIPRSRRPQEAGAAALALAGKEELSSRRLQQVLRQSHARGAAESHALKQSSSPLHQSRGRTASTNPTKSSEPEMAGMARRQAQARHDGGHQTCSGRRHHRTAPAHWPPASPLGLSSAAAALDPKADAIQETPLRVI